MKKILILVAVLIISITVAAGQSTTPTGQHLKKDGTVDKRFKAAKTASTIPPPAATGSTAASNDIKTSTPTTATHLKKDGTADKRFSASKKPASPTTVPTATAPQATTSATPNSTTKHLKADGTPDMRYKENRTLGLDKNGKPDMRYKKNKIYKQ